MRFRERPGYDLTALAVSLLGLLAAGCASGRAESGEPTGHLARFEVTGRISSVSGGTGTSETFRLRFVDTGLDILTRGENRPIRTFALAWNEPFTLGFDHFWTARGPGPRAPEITMEVSAPGCRGLSQSIRLDRLDRGPEGQYRLDLQLIIGPCD